MAQRLRAHVRVLARHECPSGAARICHDAGCGLRTRAGAGTMLCAMPGGASTPVPACAGMKDGMRKRCSTLRSGGSREL
eukprot:12803012-Alexandrium_andersonii.AAC.1